METLSSAKLFARIVVAGIGAYMKSPTAEKYTDEKYKFLLNASHSHIGVLSWQNKQLFK